ncbi:MAG TPA: hypothetical protein VD865_10805 [Stenotrophomonas sp.]|nr:hypothetical protein [Stenotrophomonas sp.]
MAKSVVMFGPKKSGKTLNAAAMLKAYGLKEFIDLDDPWFPEGAALRRRLRAGMLVLAYDLSGARDFARKHGMLLQTITDARRRLGAAWRNPR